jgi:AhpD family alkylhydroperoxidase
MRFAVRHFLADELVLIYKLLYDAWLKLKQRLRVLRLKVQFMYGKLVRQEGESDYTLSEGVFAGDALSAKMKQLIAVAVVHATWPPYCTQDHIELALREGATPEQVLEAIRVASKMRAGSDDIAIVQALIAIEMESRPCEKNRDSQVSWS